MILHGNVILKLSQTQLVCTPHVAGISSCFLCAELLHSYLSLGEEPHKKTAQKQEYPYYNVLLDITNIVSVFEVIDDIFQIIIY